MSLNKLKLIQDQSTVDWILQIFILRPDNLGDVILFTGALRLIRFKFPKAKIVICTKNYVHNLLELSPYVDEIISWDKMMKLLPAWVPDFPGKWRIESLIRKFRFLKTTGWKYRSDLYLLPVRTTIPDLHLFTSLSRAQIKLGIAGDTNHLTSEQDRSYNHLYTKRSIVDESRGIQHELDTYIDFLKLLGIDANKDELHPELWTDEQDQEWAKRIKIPNSPNEITLAIAPGVTSISDKFYTAENYRKALQGLGDERISVIIFGSRSEKDQCRAVEDALTNCNRVHSIQNFTGKTTIRQLAEALKRCDILLSNETGVLHMATALKLPTIGILGGGHYGRFYPWGNPEINLKINKPMDCYHCNWYCIYPTIRCIHEINPEQIIDRLQLLIDKVRTEKKLKSSFQAVK